MLAKLTGLVDSKEENCVVIDVKGVGYLVNCGAKTITNMPAVGAITTVLIETVVREDAFLLYGFLSTEDRDWFRLLQTVKNVGARVALAILSALPPDRLVSAIAANDRNALTAAPGVGPKLAERIISELKDKVLITSRSKNYNSDLPNSKDQDSSKRDVQIRDAVSALTNLGYSPSDSFAVVSRLAIDLGEDLEIKTLIRMSLKELSK